MNDKELKEYQSKMMRGAKGTIGLGIMTGVGSGVLSQVGSGVPGAAPAMKSANTALHLANIGNVAAVGMSMVPTLKPSGNSKGATKKKNLDNPASLF